MKKQQALKKINELIKDATSLLLDTPLNENRIEEWKREAFKCITYVFPNSNDYRIDFSMAGDNPFILDNNITKEQENDILKLDIIGKKEVIEKIQKDLEDYWEDEIIDSTIDRGKKKMKNIFISHISEEKEVALVLKEWIESTFTGQFDVFVSNDDDCINIGDKWLDKISKALDSSKILIAICSEASMPRPWINFEIGCAYQKKIYIMPVCHTGITKGTLPSPISEFQGIDLDSKEQLERFFKSIAKHLEVSKMPRISYQEMLDEINKALGKVVVKEIPKIEDAEIELSNKFNSLEEIEINILKAILEIENNSKIRRISIVDISSEIKINETKASYYVKDLVSKKLLSASYNMNLPTGYKLAQKGKGYLIENGYL